MPDDSVFIGDRIAELDAAIEDLRTLRGKARDNGHPDADILTQIINGLSLKRVELRNKRIAIRDNSSEVIALIQAFRDLNREIAQGINDLDKVRQVVEVATKVATTLDGVLKTLA